MTTKQNATSGPGFREDRHTGQFVPTVDGKDISPTSFDPDRALQIAEEAIAKGSAPKEPLHVYDWLNLPPANDAEHISRLYDVLGAAWRAKSDDRSHKDYLTLAAEVLKAAKAIAQDAFAAGVQYARQNETCASAHNKNENGK